MTDLSQLKTSEQGVFMWKNIYIYSKAISTTGIIRTETGALLYQAEIS